MQAARALGGAVPRPLVAVVAAVSTALAAAVAARSVASIWRGPVVRTFRRSDAVLCDSGEAAVIRTAAQLRGTMGGAGHVSPARLVFPASAWAGFAAHAAAELAADPQAPGPWLLAVVAVAALLAVLLPARPFFYREVTGGCVVVHPPAACARLLQGAVVPRPLSWMDPSAMQARGGDPDAGAASAGGDLASRAARPHP